MHALLVNSSLRFEMQNVSEIHLALHNAHKKPHKRAHLQRSDNQIPLGDRP